jgi:hypothetical protein
VVVVLVGGDGGVVVVVVGNFWLFAGQHSYRSISAGSGLDVKLKASGAPYAVRWHGYGRGC